MTPVTCASPCGRANRSDVRHLPAGLQIEGRLCKGNKPVFTSGEAVHRPMTRVERRQYLCVELGLFVAAEILVAGLVERLLQIVWRFPRGLLCRASLERALRACLFTLALPSRGRTLRDRVSAAATRSCPR
jgi:hypothetical protein